MNLKSICKKIDELSEGAWLSATSNLEPSPEIRLYDGGKIYIIATNKVTPLFSKEPVTDKRIIKIAKWLRKIDKQLRLDYWHYCCQTTGSMRSIILNDKRWTYEICD